MIHKYSRGTFTTALMSNSNLNFLHTPGSIAAEANMVQANCDALIHKASEAKHGNKYHPAFLSLCWRQPKASCNMWFMKDNTQTVSIRALQALFLSGLNFKGYELMRKAYRKYHSKKHSRGRLKAKALKLKRNPRMNCLKAMVVVALKKLHITIEITVLPT